MHSNEEAFQKPINPKLKYSNNFLIMHTSSVRCKCCDTSSDLKKNLCIGKHCVLAFIPPEYGLFLEKEKKGEIQSVGYHQIHAGRHPSASTSLA